ncbi:MAG TPA: antibiotic biosynthesis monooxygenase [Ktedonobacteraceae bacterium]|nr:antibiotic biosynthesis monooxygenase [Ktedonobacteraceae bacterium]
MAINSQKMTIAVEQSPSISTIIAVMPTKPDQAGNMLAQARQRAEVLSRAEGFIATAIHHSIDGRRVFEYSQWLSESSWREAIQRLSEHERDDLAQWDARLYEVELVFNVSGSTTLEIAEQSGLVAMINVLSTDSGRQSQLMDVWRKGAEQYWEQVPGAVAAALLRSEDGMRLINYAQWTSGEAWQRARPKAGDNRAGGHGLGTSDPHLYQLDTILLASSQQTGSQERD